MLSESVMSRIGGAVVSVVLACGLCACVSGVEEVPRSEESQEKLLNGSPTFDRPEIGRISGCTATLIAPNVVISAAHCLDYQSREQAGIYGSFTVDLGPGQSRSFVIERFLSYSGELGRGDVALLRLATAVPPSVAMPTALAASSAQQGQRVTVYGYGCTERATQRGGLIKRKYAYGYGRSSNLCPGDSGGPVVIGDDGAVFLINSGYYVGSGVDLFGEPWRFRQTLLDQIADWDARYGAPEVPSAVSVLNSTGAPLFVRCDGEDSATCSGWSLLQSGQSTAVLTSGRRLIIDNQDALPGARFSLRRLTAPTDSVVIYANLDDPFSPSGDAGDDAAPPLQEDFSCLGGDDFSVAEIIDAQVQGRVCAQRASWLSFEAEAGEEIGVTVTFEHSRGDIDVVLYGPDRNQLDASNGTGDLESVTAEAPTTGTYLLRVYGYNGAANEVSVELSLSGQRGPLPEDGGGGVGCVEEPDEPNDEFRQAGQLGRGTFPGAVCGDDSDWYLLDVQGGWFLSVSFQNAVGDLDVQAYDLQGRQIGLSQGVDDMESIQGRGAAYVRVYGYGGATNSYEINLQ